MNRVAVDGLVLATSVPLPGLPLVRRRPDWTLEIEREDPAQADVSAVRWTGHVRDADRRWCRYGREGDLARILLDPWFELRLEATSRRAVLRHARGRRADALVLRRALPYLAAATGRLALHAAAAIFPAGAVLFCADSRTGKSTLALALDRLGVPVLGDDHVIVEAAAEGAPWVRPSVPWLEVGAASRRAFAHAVRARRADLGGDRVGLLTTRPASGARLAGLVFLRRGAALRWGRVSARVALPRLLRAFAFVADPADAAEHAARFLVASGLVTAAPVRSLALPQGLGRLRGAVPRLVAAWGAAPPGDV